MVNRKPPRRYMAESEGISNSKAISWLILIVGTVGLSTLGYVGNKISQNTDHIPVMESTLAEQQVKIKDMQAQTSDVPLIKLQMEYITKQLEHINSSEDVMSHAVEEGRNKLADHERRIQALESEIK